MPGMTGIIVSTVAYFVAAYFIKRQLVDMGIPAGATRSLSLFVLALAVSCGVGYAVDLMFP